MWNSLPLWCFLHLALICTVEGVSMTVNPSQVILSYTGQGQAPKTIFRCDGISSASNVKRFSSMKIQRFTKRENNLNQPIIIASIYPDEGGSIPPVPETTDIQNRATVTGTVDKLDFPMSYLQLEMDTNAIQCNDVGQYTCLFTYDDVGDKLHTEDSFQNLTVTALPSDVQLSARRFGQEVFGTSTRPYLMKEGEEIEFTCNGNIGSNPNLHFEWWKTGTSGLIKFRPEVQPNAVETKGEVNPNSAHCTNSRTTTMKYNISRTDRGSILFMCFAQETTPSGYYVVNSTTAFYIDIEGTNGGGGESGGSTENEVAGASAGVIAGAVIGAIAFIVIVVLLVYFLWYRRRGGDTTREVTDGSNPNLAPSAADLYATPKDRNKHGHENRGMDDHEANHLRKGHKDRDYDRRRYDDDYDHKGHHNYALDDDFESRDGSPSVQHMSDGPIGTGV